MAAGDSVKHGNFTFTETSIEGVLVVDVTAYGDERGYFVETYKRPDFVAGGIDCEFVQDNQSSSVKGVLRGLHFQICLLYTSPCFACSARRRWRAPLFSASWFPCTRPRAGSSTRWCSRFGRRRTPGGS